MAKMDYTYDLPVPWCASPVLFMRILSMSEITFFSSCWACTKSVWKNRIESITVPIDTDESTCVPTDACVIMAANGSTVPTSLDVNWLTTGQCWTLLFVVSSVSVIGELYLDVSQVQGTSSCFATRLSSLTIFREQAKLFMACYQRYSTQNR